MQKVENGKFVSIHYTGTLDNGDVFDSTEGDKPMELKIGSGNVIKGFEDAIIGMDLKEKKVFSINPEDAYGNRVESHVHSIPRKDVPPEMELNEGDYIGIKTPEGNQIPAQIIELDDEKVVIDLNHPLAGKVLTFDVEVVGISDTATQTSDPCDSGCDCSSGCH